MGKRKKSSRGPTKKLKQTLATTFSCLFCNHENSVVCVMDKKGNVGNLSCKVCGQTFQSKINALSAPIDVYSDWIDACEAVQTKGSAASDSKFVVDDEEEGDGDYDDERPTRSGTSAAADRDGLSDLEEDEFE